MYVYVIFHHTIGLETILPVRDKHIDNDMLSSLKIMEYLMAFNLRLKFSNYGYMFISELNIVNDIYKLFQAEHSLVGFLK